MTAGFVSERSRSTSVSPMRALIPAAKRAQEQGIKIYHLNIGQPNLSSPSEFFAGVKNYNEKQVPYEETQGYKPLRVAWSQFFSEHSGFDLSWKDILITNGASESVLFALSACCDAGDEVIVFDPSYANYLGLGIMAGVKLLAIPRSIHDGFKLPPRQKIISAITGKTRAILLCNPDNPTGKLYSPENLKGLLQICEEHNLFLIVDEVYREFVYDGALPSSIFSAAPRNERVVLVDSLSKRFSLCGSRLGCIATFNEAILTAVTVFASLRLSAPVIEQYAACYMFNNMQKGYLQNSVSAFQAQRDALCTKLASHGGFIFQQPEGAFYVTAKIPVSNSLDFATFLLSEFSVNKSTVFVTPAQGFYFGKVKGMDELRLAFVLDKEQMQQAADLLCAGLTSYLEKVTVQSSLNAKSKIVASIAKGLNGYCEKQGGK